MNEKEILSNANHLRRNGNWIDSIKLYDSLLLKQPNNDEYLFGKAMALINLNPIEAIKLFKKVIDINPNVSPAYNNIAIAACTAEKYEEAINIYNELINKFPNKLELIYYRATLLGNAGYTLNALLDCYFVVDNTELRNDPQAFLKNPISQDIALGKVRLRNETFNKRISDLSIYDKLSHADFKEYHYTLPAKITGDENFYIDFGTYSGYPVSQILKTYPNHIVGYILNIDSFCVSEEILEIIRLQGISTSKCEQFNIAKLHLLEDKKSNEGNDTF
jgi:tetratricopeptide (TPR) repeat protein